MSLSTIAALVGFILLFLGERIFGTRDVVRLVVDIAGFGAILAAILLRFRSIREASPDARQAHRQALIFLGVSVLGMVVYSLGLQAVVDLLSLTDDPAKNWKAVTGALWPILAATGLVPMILVDRAIMACPAAPHPLRTRGAVENGVSVVLALSLLFPLNYLSHEFNKRWDLTYFKTSAPSDSTKAMVANLTEPVRIVMFFPGSSEVSEEVRPYFEALEGANLSLELSDQAMEPALAKELKVRDNGNIVMVQGDKNETLKLDTDFEKAKKKLKTLDADVQKTLSKLATGSRTVYFTAGHGEVSFKNEDDPARKITLLKKLLEAMNFKVKEMGLGDGLASSIPEDAAMVFVLGPQTPFLAEEIASLRNYAERGGRLLVALDPTHEAGLDLSPLLGDLGLAYADTPLATDEANSFLPLTNGPKDHQNLATNRYSSHESVTTLSKFSDKAWMVFPGTGSIEETEGHKGKVTVTVRSLAKAFNDTNGNFAFDSGETESRKVWNLAVVASGPSTDPAKEYRAVVTGDVDFLSDVLIGGLKANAQFILDASRWLAGEEALAGEVNNEEDVKIIHNKEGQGIWFYGTTFILPALVGIVGLFRVRRRRQKGVA